MTNEIVTADGTLGAEIIREHEAAQANMREAVQHAIACGRLLLRVKEDLQHGEFGAFCKTLPFAERTAQAYMQLARDPNPQRFADLTFGEALRLMRRRPAGATPPTQKGPDRIVALVLDDLEKAVRSLSSMTTVEEFLQLVTLLCAELVRKGESLRRVNGFEHEVCEEAKRRLPEIAESLKAARDKAHKEFLKYAAMRKGVAAQISEGDYRFLLNVLHPDRVPADRAERFARAFDIVRKLEPYVAACKGR